MILGATAVTVFPQSGMLPQPGTVSFTLGIPRESLMRSYLMTSADRTDAPPPNSVVLHIWGPPPKPRPFAAAMSWLMTSFIDGMAAYGEMICPYLVDLPDPHTDQNQPGSGAPWPLYRQSQPNEPPPPAAPPPARGGIGARLARWLTWLRPRRDQAPRAFEHERLDARTMRDIGLPPYHPDDLAQYLERYVDHGGW